MGITNQRDSNRTQSFTYDGLNRVLYAKTQGTSGNMCWGQAFGYDPWGNLAVVNSTLSGCAAPTLDVSIGKNNQINSAGFNYDAAGNLLTDGVFTYTWNAEGRMTTVTSSLYGSETYTYDGDGHRVRKQAAGRLYWYGSNGEVLAETGADGSNPTEYIFFGGKRVARRDSSGNVSYYLSDSLGSSRVMTDSSGNILDDCDFLPYGSQVCVASSSGNHYMFTGLERDSESGLDHTLNRQYASNYGRWLSPDPGGTKVVKLDDPQMWNMYGYVRDNPLILADPMGLQGGCTNQSTSCQRQKTKERAEMAAEGAANLAVAGVKLKGTLALSATAETGVGAVATAYAAVSTAGSALVGVTQEAGAATGKTDAAGEAADAVAAVTSASGFVTMVTTGSVHKGATVAAVEGMITARGDLASGSRAERAVKALDLTLNTKTVIQAVRSWVNEKIDLIQEAVSD